MIYQKPLFKEVFILSIVVALLHYVATIYSLYWSISWYDIMMHFLGGFLIGIIAIWIFFTSDKINYPKNNRLVVFVTTMSTVLVIGLAWELWELFVGFSDVYLDKIDTAVDIIMDIVGSIFAYFYGLKKMNLSIWPKKQN